MSLKNAAVQAGEFLATRAAQRALDYVAEHLLQHDTGESSTTRADAREAALAAARSAGAPVPRAPLTNRGRVLMVNRSGKVFFRGVRPRRGRARRRRVVFRRRRGRFRTGIGNRARRAVRRLTRLTRVRRARMVTLRAGQRRISTRNVSVGYKRPRSVRVPLFRMRRSRGWYRQGLWYLTGGSYYNQLSGTGTQVNRRVSSASALGIQFSSDDGTIWPALGFMQGVFLDNNYTVVNSGVDNALVVTSMICFNFTQQPIQNPELVDQAYFGLNPLSGATVGGNAYSQYHTVAAWVKHSVCEFFYADSLSSPLDRFLGDGWSVDTPLARMPPVPCKRVSFLSGTAYPFSMVTTSNNQTNASIRMVPYSVRWSYVYARFRYSIKVMWPVAWAELRTGSLISGTSPRNPPNNPPFVVRLIGVRYTTDEALDQRYFPRYYFPLNASIRSRPKAGYRSALWKDYKGIVFFEKMFSFNGQLLPKSTGEENLIDGQEGVFTVRCPYKTYNNYTFPLETQSSIGDVRMFWPTSSLIGRIRFYCYAAFDGDPAYFSKLFVEGESVQNLMAEYAPSCSVMFQPTYYCYPSLKEPHVKYVLSDKSSMEHGAGLMSVSPITGELVSLKQANKDQILKTRLESVKHVTIDPSKSEVENIKDTEAEKTSEEEPAHRDLDSLPSVQAGTAEQTLSPPAGEQ